MSWVVGGKAAMDCRRAYSIILDIVDAWTDNLGILYTYTVQTSIWLDLKFKH